MGGKVSKKKNYMTKFEKDCVYLFNFVKFRKIELNSITEPEVNNFNYPPITTEPITCLSKKNSNVGYCGFNNGSISVINFNNSRIKFSTKGHEKEVTRMKYLTKSCQLCTVSRDKSIKLWSQIDEGGIDEELRCDFTLSNAHDLIISGLDISSDETTILTGSRDNTIKLWDLPKFTQKADCKISRNLVTCVKYSPTNSFIVATGEDKIIRIFDPSSLNVTMEFPKKRYIQTCCDVSFDEKYVISASNGFNGNGCELTLWDVRMKKILYELIGHQATVNCCMFISNDWFSTSDSCAPRIFSCGSDNSLILWNTMETQNSPILSNHYVPSSGIMTSILPLENQKLAVGTYNTGIVILEYNTARGSLYHVASI